MICFIEECHKQSELNNNQEERNADNPESRNYLWHKKKGLHDMLFTCHRAGVPDAAHWACQEPLPASHSEMPMQSKQCINNQKSDKALWATPYRYNKESSRVIPYIILKVCQQHLLVDCRWCCLSEVNDPCLILTDVVHQHNASTDHQKSKKWSSNSYLMVVLLSRDWSVPITHPPIPDVWGCTIPKQRAAVMAASTLEPCFSRTSKPRDVHWATSVTTAPWLKTLQ